MTKTDLTRTLATIACTLVMSTACVLGAVAPARSGASQTAAATAAPVA